MNKFNLIQAFDYREFFREILLSSKVNTKRKYVVNLYSHCFWKFHFNQFIIPWKFPPNTNKNLHTLTTPCDENMLVSK